MDACASRSFICSGEPVTVSLALDRDVHLNGRLDGEFDVEAQVVVDAAFGTELSLELFLGDQT